MIAIAPCPCGSRKPQMACCAPYLKGTPAPTAEALMRSRYTAFCVGDVDYLIATQHPSRRQPSDRAVLRQTIANTRWMSLTILSTEQGQPEDITGMVEFVACYEGETAGQLHERSRFVQEHGRWFYVDGDVRTL